MTLRAPPKGEYGAIYTGDRGICNFCGINKKVVELDSLSAGQTAVLQRYCRAINVSVPPPSGLACKDEVECNRMITQRIEAT